MLRHPAPFPSPTPSSRRRNARLERALTVQWGKRTPRSGFTPQLQRAPGQGKVCLELRGTLPPYREGPPLRIHFKEDE